MGVGLTHCIIYSKKYLEELNKLKIPIRKNICKNIDYILQTQAKIYDFYTYKDNLTTQIESYSDITFCNVCKGYI